MSNKPLAGAVMVHPIVFIDEELSARGWTRRDLAERMRGDASMNELALEFYALQETNLVLALEDAKSIAVAFGTNPDFFINLEKSWREAVIENVRKPRATSLRRER